MEPIEDFAQAGSIAAGGAVAEAPASGITVGSVIRLLITGTRGGGPVEQVNTVFNHEGVCLNNDLTEKEGAFPLDLSGINGGAVLPMFPIDEYAAAQAANNADLVAEITAAHTAALAKVAKGGRVAGPDLSGKWICPMHLEVVKDAADKCDLCGMPLEPAENLGYVPAGEAEPPLVIPATAPLTTGKRAVVYVAVPGRKGVFEGREIVLGPRAGDYYIVREGLEERELVVTNGAFKIDADLQIKAKPSMMSPGGGPSAASSGGPKAQTTCPVMGGKINRKLHADHDGKRVYFCCPGCFEPFKKDPAKYIKKLEDQGVTVEKAPAAGGK